MKLFHLSAAVLAAALLAGCAIEPVAVRPAHVGVYVPPPGVAYVAPTYAMPAPGYVWMHHPHYGWGWHHPEHGWHYGWR